MSMRRPHARPFKEGGRENRRNLLVWLTPTILALLAILAVILLLSNGGAP